MPKSQVLVLHLSSSSQLARDLENLLGSRTAESDQIEVVSTALNFPHNYRNELEQIISSAAPGLSILVAPSDHEELPALVSLVRHLTDDSPVAVVVEKCESDGLLQLLRAGASDFILPPLRALEILPRVLRLLDKASPREAMVSTLKQKLGIKSLVGESPRFLREIQKLPQIARCTAAVLIHGETGTGKEMCARAIHYLSPQSSRPFVPVNCGAIPTELVENELFGHQGGAFTGARASQPGLIDEANEGTLFLDEVDCLPMLAQVKLLRCLQDGEYRPLGSTKVRRAAIRVIAATNTDLERAVSENKLRRDLYYRLNIVEIKLPPLRDRAEDIPVLARHFLSKYAREFNKQVAEFAPDALRRLASHDWPGNVRELEHVVQRATVLSEERIIRASDLMLASDQPGSEAESLREAKARVVGHFERNYIKGLLLAYKGNITRAAEAAGKNRRAFWELIRKHRIDVESLRLNRMEAKQ